jgi:hypothetical protein
MQASLERRFATEEGELAFQRCLTRIKIKPVETGKFRTRAKE